MSEKPKKPIQLDKIDKEFKGTINVKHALEVFYKDVGLEKNKKRS